MICVGHRASQIRDCLGDGSRLGVDIEYSVEPEMLLGTGGALRLAERFFQPYALVLNGDTYLAANYTEILRHHVGERAEGRLGATMTLARLEESRRFGTVLLESSGRYVTGFHEKVENPHDAGWLNAGAYVIERELLARIPRDITCSLERDVFPAALADGIRLAAHRSSQPFFDIGTAEDFQRFRRLYDGWRQQLTPEPGRTCGMISPRNAHPTLPTIGRSPNALDATDGYPFLSASAGRRSRSLSNRRAERSALWSQS